MEKKLLRRLAALALVCVTLTGCGGGKGGDQSGADKNGASSAAPAQSSAAPSASGEEQVDYSKYNTYLDLSSDIYELEDVLAAYFNNVEYQADFALTEGGDYANVKEAVEWHTPIDMHARQAQDYADEEPAYPDADQAVKNLGSSVVDVMDAVDKIASYVRFDDYEKDSLAQAPQLHSALWKALETYDAYYVDFLNAVDALAEQMEDGDNEKLLEEGQMILYHSACMIDSGKDIMDEIWAQVEAAAAEQTGEDFALPAIDMTNLSPLFGEFNTAYEGLTKALESKEEQEKVFADKTAESSTKLYKTRADALVVKMGELAQVLMDGGDYSAAYDAANEPLNNFIDSYNSILN